MALERGTFSSSSHWDGSLSPKEFCIAAMAFVEKWKRFNPSFSQWSWISPKRFPIAADTVEGYLSLVNIAIPKYAEDNYDEGINKSKEEVYCDEEDESNDNATLVQSYDDEVHHYDFHVVYSNSYRVPVLYFRAYCSDGQPLMLDDIEKDLPANSAKVLKESKWTFITHEEHPYLNRPWYTLHPCGTSEWMKLLYSDKDPMIKDAVLVDRYIVSWFSVVGQVVGLRIPLEMLSRNDSSSTKAEGRYLSL